MKKINSIGVVGTGLMGTSLAMHIHRIKKNVELFGADPSGAEREKALEKGVFTDIFVSHEDMPSCDLFFVCSPIEYAENIAAYLCDKFPSSHITDISSVKKEICDKLKNFKNFTGGHPMTGTERKGAHAAHPDIFDNSLYILCPATLQNHTADIFDTFLRSLNINIYRMSPEEHDRCVAYASHLPYFVAASLVIASDNELYEHICNMAGSGFRDTTRVAGSPSGMWNTILKYNRNNIRSAFSDFIRVCQNTLKVIEKDESTSFSDRARNMRREMMSSKLRRDAGFVLEVNVPDRPGVLGRIFTLLENINIRNIEIDDSRESRTGALTIFFRTENDMIEAQKRLKDFN